MKYVYIDWNIFNKIEQKDSLSDEEFLIFDKIERLILNKDIICPYSNAHINDLLRGYKKNSIYIDGHLEILKYLTGDLCIVQYWGRNSATWHYRDVKEFFNSAIKDGHSLPDFYLDLCSWDETGLWAQQINLLRSIKIPTNLKDIYKANPIFEAMFPKTKEDMNILAMCEDLYQFSNNAKKDYLLYKSLKKYMNQSRARLKQQQKILKDINKSMSEIPSYLENDSFYEKYLPKTKTSNNDKNQQITDTFFKLDIKGFKSDEKFANMIDDSLHTFYGAHCEYFLTIDDKCHYKATETYHKLGIPTICLKPYDFIKIIDI
ncbi:hypothetical protein [Dysgonomonas sp. BGC7]|uniref:hypothetical protein n=1 Tax=Dysgonomonas sp. BGC7 TaxID=1658008 RepID=UPI00068247B6|nr:hypothetical protein [Dysgonomonas sp. BGC7]MBD8387417.1 hypothetical protein [Dysgonomonas sp. BGC7]